MKIYLVKQENGYLTRVHCHSESQFKRWLKAQLWEPAVQETALCLPDTPADCVQIIPRWWPN